MSAALEVEAPAKEGSVDWAAAREFALGKERTEEIDTPDAGVEPDAAERRQFRYKGKTIDVDPETAELLEDLRNQARGQNGRLGAELARTRERLARLEGGAASRQVETPAADRPQRPDPQLAIKDYAAYDRQMAAYEAAKEAEFEARIASRLEADKEHARKVAESERRNTEWASGFYSTYDHLDNPILKPTIAQVYAENKAAIDEIEATEGQERAHEELARLADNRIVEVTKVVKSPTNSRRPPRVESTGGTPPRREAPAEPPKPFSAASWSAKERARMRGDGAK